MSPTAPPAPDDAATAAARRIVEWYDAHPVDGVETDDTYIVALALLSRRSPAGGGDQDSSSPAVAAPFASTAWQPIETAPKDGTEFQAWVGHWEPRCRYNEDGAFQIWGRVDYDMDDWDFVDLTPTRWMPEPASPNAAETVAESKLASTARPEGANNPSLREEMVEALRRIEKWFGEFPETGKFWDKECTQPMGYAACYGSNGERDFMREIARKALTSSEGSPTRETGFPEHITQTP